jgi:hypothetical protein
MAVRLSVLRTDRALLSTNIMFLLLVLQGLARQEGLGKLKKFTDLIEFQTHELLACSIVPQPLRYRVPRITCVPRSACKAAVKHLASKLKCSLGGSVVVMALW